MVTYAGVVFDLDETLVDRHGSLTRYASGLWRLHRHLIELGEDDFIARFHEIDDRARTPRKAFFERFTSSVLPHLGVAEFEEHFFDGAWAAPILFDGVVELLSSLREGGYRTGIITNGGQRPQSAKILNSGLDKMVDAFLISESFGASKPAPEIYAAMAERLQLDLQRSWFVGDCPVADVVGSTRAGFKAIWVERYTPWPPNEPAVYHAKIRTVADLLDVIDPVRV